MPRSLIALGANLGDRRATLERAVDLLAAHPDIERGPLSSWHETLPVGGPAGQQTYLNAALIVETSLAPQALLQVLLDVENELRRMRDVRWGARTADLDLLLYEQAIVETAELQVPHPRMSFRRFVLEPAVEIARDWVHPLSGQTLGGLLEHLRTTADYVAVLGMPGPERRQLAEVVAAETGGTYLADPVADWEVTSRSDPSSPDFWQPIQFLDRAAELLRQHVGSGSRPIVSDFYFDECLAYGRASLDVEAGRQLERQWQSLHAAVPCPRLLVVLDSWEVAAAIRLGREPKPRGTLPAERLRRELVSLSLRPEPGAVVYVPPASLVEQVQEIAAAMTAAR